MDRDDPTSPNADLYYTLVSQIPNKNNIAFFQINHKTGEISTTELGEPPPDTHTDRNLDAGAHDGFCSPWGSL